MGLIYVNPEGPNGNPDPLASARDIRETFGRMAMNDEETVALIAGGHTFGKTHGAGQEEHIGPDPEAAPMENMGLGWKNDLGTGKGDDTITSGLEVTWTYHPTRWDNEFFHILFSYEWELFKSPGGAWQWRPTNGAGDDLVPLAHDPSRRREPRMLTSDLALRMDPAYEKVSRRFYEHPEEFADAFARAWFKLTHRDMGPKARYLGPEVPAEELLWQDPLPAVDHELIDDADAAALKEQILASGLSVSQLVSTTWAAASSYRGSDKRGGVNGARIRLAPQKDWEVNNPIQLAVGAGDSGGHPGARSTTSQTGGKKVSLADLIVLAGNAGGRGRGQGRRRRGEPYRSTRVGWMRPSSRPMSSRSATWSRSPTDSATTTASTRELPAEYLLVDKANLLTLSAPEMTVLVGGMRVLETNWDGASTGMLTERPGVLSNDFFVNLLELGNTWKPLDPGSHAFQATEDATGEPKWIGSRADLVFGSNSELRAVAEVYASDDANEKFVHDFVKAWTKVTELDRFDLR